MDCLTDVLTYVVGPGNISVALLSMKGQKCLIKHILISVPKVNEGLTGLDRHEVE